MNAIYTRALTILPSMCDAEGRLGVPNAFALFMDIATEHAEELGIGMNSLTPRGLFWLTVRTKLRFHRRPGMTERVEAVTWPETPERSRCNRDYLLRKGDEVLIEGKTEWMVMNLRTGRLHPADSLFPEGLAIADARALPGPFMRMDENFDGAVELPPYTVRSTDIDLGGHMNNAAYLRALLGCFSAAEVKELDIRQIDMVFRAPCYEGDELELRRCPTEAGLDLAFLREGKPAFLARLG